MVHIKIIHFWQAYVIKFLVLTMLVMKYTIYSIPFITKLEYTLSIIHYTGKNYFWINSGCFFKISNLKHIHCVLISNTSRSSLDSFYNWNSLSNTQDPPWSYHSQGIFIYYTYEQNNGDQELHTSTPRSSKYIAFIILVI